MNVIVRKGKVIRFSDHGDLGEQVKNLSALIRHVQKHATQLQTAADDALSVNPQLVALNRALQHQVATLQNTLEITDKQLKRNREEKLNAKREGACDSTRYRVDAAQGSGH